MKKITNWRNATVFDIEADGLLDVATKMHVLGYQRVSDKEPKNISSKDDNFYPRVRKFFQYHIDKGIPVVAHNGIGFDIRLVESLLGMDLSNLMVIDTLGLSWYLNHKREVHGLDSFHEDYGIAKPKIDDWENLSIEEYINRVTEDVKINKALWVDLMGRLEDMYTLSKEAIDNGLVGGSRTSPDEEIYLDSLVGLSVDEHIDRILTYIMFKLDCVALQEKTRWKADTKFMDQSLEELSGLLSEAQVELEAVMPKVPQYAPRKKPAKMYKKNGDLSESGKKWAEISEMIKADARDDMGNPMVIVNDDGSVKLLTSYNEPNINSSSQIKDFLYSKGWEPETFKYVRDKEAFDKWIKSKPKQGSKQILWQQWKMDKPVDRKVPQISVDGKNGKELCPSVIRLAEDVPEILAYSSYSMIKHRHDLLKGMRQNVDKDGFLQASAKGFTNTFRLKHRGIVNLPGVDKPYGKNIRGALIPDKGEVSLGSDLSSLEDAIKQHFMLPIDPDYVSEMLEEGYDPHIKVAVVNGLLTEEEGEQHKSGNGTDKTNSARKKAKQINYSSVYNIGPPALARGMGITESEAENLLDGYWKLNFSVKVIAEEQYVITCGRGYKWLVNPINGFCYSLRKDSDKFSTLCQGTGAFMFDMWIDKILDGMLECFGVKKLAGQQHDEYVCNFKDTTRNRTIMEKITKDSIANVSKEFKLRRPLGCEVQFGYSYAEIH